MAKKIPYWQVDAFTNQPFQGNPAAVFVLQEDLDEELMQKIAMEMNLSESAFIFNRGEDRPPLLRWFTPTMEIDLCGHATIAATHVFLNEIYPDRREVTFDTKFVGLLRVVQNETGYTMDFPSRLGEKVSVDKIPEFVIQALGQGRPVDAYQSRDLMLVFEDEKSIYNMKPDFNALKDFKEFLIVTAHSQKSEYDFVSRFFCADEGISEDPVTGSAHCTSGPYWANKLKKSKLRAYQASKRGGELDLELKGDRILISGSAVTVSEGKLVLR